MSFGFAKQIAKWVLGRGFGFADRGTIVVKMNERSLGAGDESEGAEDCRQILAAELALTTGSKMKRLLLREDRRSDQFQDLVQQRVYLACDRTRLVLEAEFEGCLHIGDSHSSLPNGY